MTIQQKIALVSDPTKFYLFKEGAFYKVYNQNAMWFTTHVKPYKVKVKFVNQFVYVVGFPMHAVTTNGFVSKGLSLLEEQNSFICYQCKIDSAEQEYLQWCNQLQEIDRNNTALAEKQTMVLQKINRFDVVNSTPVQCLAFVSALKGMLK